MHRSLTQPKLLNSPDFPDTDQSLGNGLPQMRPIFVTIGLLAKIR
jgi:hypothetical protein